MKGLACLVWAHLHTVAMNENRLLRFASLKIKNWQNNLRDERNSFYSILYLVYLIIFILMKIMISISIDYQKSLLRIVIYDCIADVQYLFMVSVYPLTKTIQSVLYNFSLWYTQTIVYWRYFRNFVSISFSHSIPIYLGWQAFSIFTQFSVFKYHL